jgi:starch-binding outer membrane protein SusE/F
MKYINKILFLPVLMLLIMSGCQKVAELPHYENGSPVTLTASKNAVVAAPADSLNNVVTFTWSDPRYATDTNSFKFILEIDSSGRNFSKEVTKVVTGDLSTSLTGKELNAIVLNYGFSLGTPYEMDVRVISSYGNNNERYLSNVLKISVTPYNDPSVLSSTSASVSPTLNTAAQNALTFSWTRSFNGYGGVVTYSLQYDSATKNFAAPKEIAVGASLYSKALTQGEINATALSSGVPGGNLGKIEYRIKAVTALGAISYSNTYSVTIQSYFPLLRLYLPGSYQSATGYGPGDWEPTTAPEFVRDLRDGLLNNMYYLYIYLPAGAQFKITEGRSWAVNYGGTAGNLELSSNSNLGVTNAGVYRISVNRATMKFDIRLGRMGFVGGGTGAGWNPPNVFPNYAMGAPATNLFVGLTDLGTDAWKMIDNDQWNNGSNAVDETRSYGASGASGSSLETNGPNNFAAVATAGRYRAIWDGRNVDNVKYEMSPASEMRLVGDGINQVGVADWDPPSSPQMTYGGNGIWTITINLKANKDIKFLAGNAWGAFDYEDNSGQSQATGTSKKIRWDGDKNFKTPATAGSYTITLNENTQSMTIN